MMLDRISIDVYLYIYEIYIYIFIHMFYNVFHLFPTVGTLPCQASPLLPTLATGKPSARFPQPGRINLCFGILISKLSLRGYITYNTGNHIINLFEYYIYIYMYNVISRCSSLKLCLFGTSGLCTCVYVCFCLPLCMQARISLHDHCTK